MEIRIQFEMREGDREWVGSINTMTAKTIAQAQQWVMKQVPLKQRGDVEVDAVLLFEIGKFTDDDGEPCDEKWIGTYEPAADQWCWNSGI